MKTLFVIHKLRTESYIRLKEILRDYKQQWERIHPGMDCEVEFIVSMKHYDKVVYQPGGEGNLLSGEGSYLNPDQIAQDYDADIICVLTNDKKLSNPATGVQVYNGSDKNINRGSVVSQVFVNEDLPIDAFTIRNMVFHEADRHAMTVWVNQLFGANISHDKAHEFAFLGTNLPGSNWAYAQMFIKPYYSRLKAKMLTPDVGSAYDLFQKNLEYNNQGHEVEVMQKFLAKHGYLTDKTGVVWTGPWGYFGGLTRKAVIRFQEAYGITPAKGYWYSKTRKVANAIVDTGMLDKVEKEKPVQSNVVESPPKPPLNKADLKPPEFILNLRPDNEEEIDEIFGDTYKPSWNSNNLSHFTPPYPVFYLGERVKTIRCHRLVKDRFVWVFDMIKKYGLEKELTNFGGIYADRDQRGGDNPSTHSWGIAIDCEPQKYPLGSDKTMHQDVITIFEAAGFTYGGNFARRDPMHFQYAGLLY